ncbi:MAG: hypothetical protein Tsb009_07620 [Planctomycetaceae bacterium]
MAIALHNYHETYGSFPPAVMYDKDGKPMHSWRVLILPFLEQGHLYKEYRLDEPWNSPHNSKLAYYMPREYRCPSYDSFLSDHEIDGPEFKVLTNYVAIVGPGTIFEKGRAITHKDVTDGTGKTIMLAETSRRPVHWMQPDDITPAKLVIDLRLSKGEKMSNHEGGLHVLFADGAVRFLSSDVSLKTLRALCTRAGDETIDDDAY